MVGPREEGESVPSFADELEFLRQHVEVIELSAPGGSGRLAVVPAWQGRIALSAVDRAAPGFGWLNSEFIASGAAHPQIHAYGGEDRFWLGPESGQFSIFNPPGGAFDLSSWRTPADLDTAPYEVAATDAHEVRCVHRARFQNWSGTTFDVAIDRVLRCLPVGAEEGVDAVAFESVNTITNLGSLPWERSTGLLAVWTIGMFRPGASTIIVVPYVPGDTKQLGPIVNNGYFGAVPDERLAVGESAVFFKGDGEWRSKIGISPERATGVLGSWDPGRGVLTVVSFDLPDEPAPYVNQMWEHQDDPYRGDAIHSYNDGAWEAGGDPLGPFYELETSSPAAALAPNASLTHRHRTEHFTGAREALELLAEQRLGVSLGQVEQSLRRRGHPESSGS